MDELMNRDWFGMAQEVKRLRDLGEDKSFSKDKVSFLFLGASADTLRKVEERSSSTVLNALFSYFARFSTCRRVVFLLRGFF